MIVRVSCGDLMLLVGEGRVQVLWHHGHGIGHQMGTPDIANISRKHRKTAHNSTGVHGQMLPCLLPP